MLAFYYYKLPPSANAYPFSHQIYIHRATTPDYHENFIQGLILNQIAGFRHFEVDVHVTKDFVPILSHDDSLLRFAKIKKQVSHETWASIRQLRKSHPKYYMFGALQRLEKVLYIAKVLNLVIDLDVKSTSDNKRLAKTIVEIIQKHNLYQHVFVASFYPDILYHIRQFDPQVITALDVTHVKFKDSPIINQIYLWAMRSWVPKLLGVGLIEVHRDMISSDYVKNMTAKGYYINAWTVNKASIKQYYYDDLDIGLITDCPDLYVSCAHDKSNMMDRVKVE